MVLADGDLRKAGKVLSNEEKLDLRVSDTLRRILSGRSSFAASGIRRSATCRQLSKATREAADSCTAYLFSHSEYPKYNKYLKKGYQVATGVTEGACRHPVKDRTEITGARWSLKGAEAILKLGAVRISGDFPDYRKFYEQQYIRNHRILYQNPTVLEGN